jgi:hypothetical protein
MKNHPLMSLVEIYDIKTNRISQSANLSIIHKTRNYLLCIMSIELEYNADVRVV